MKLYLLCFLFFFKPFTYANVKKEKNASHNNKIKDDILSIYKWAKKNNIYINSNLQLYKNELNDINHNFYYFKSNDTIQNNTLLLTIPSDIMISQPSLDSSFKKSKNIKFSDLWEKIFSINKYLSYPSAKQLFYISIILSDSVLRQKGSFYKKYKEYLDMYEYINLDHFPLLYNLKEMIYLNNSYFGKEIKNNLKSINNEYYLIKHELDLDQTVLVDEFTKYRILSLSNSIQLKNVVYVVPFIDCFKKKVNKTDGIYNAYVKIKKNKNNGIDLEIYSKKTIMQNNEIYLLWKQISNIESLLYYGFIDENNLITSEFLVELINRNYKKDLNFDELGKKYNITFDELIKPKSYDLNNEFYSEYLYYSYRNISIYFDQYYHFNEGPYLMMKDNLEYYLRLYEEMYTNELINRNIMGINKRKYVKNILALEKKLIENRMKLLDNKIRYFRKEKQEKDIFELLKRTSNIKRKNKYFEF